MIRTDKDAIVTPELCTLLEYKHTWGDQPEYMLKQLQELKQEQKDIKDFIIEFENLKLLAKISDDHTLETLQTNVSWEMMKNFIAYYGPSVNYQGLRSNLIKISRGDAYLKAIFHPTFT